MYCFFLPLQKSKTPEKKLKEKPKQAEEDVEMESDSDADDSSEVSIRSKITRFYDHFMAYYVPVSLLF